MSRPVCTVIGTQSNDLMIAKLEVLLASENALARPSSLEQRGMNTREPVLELLRKLLTRMPCLYGRQTVSRLGLTPQARS